MPSVVTNPSKRARVVWIDRPPFASGRYVSASRFPADTEWPGGDTWSVILEISEGETVARFLSSEAPHARLHKGATFEMFEGAKLAAAVTIID